MSRFMKAMTCVLALSILACLGGGSDEPESDSYAIYNLDEEPTDGGIFDGETCGEDVTIGKSYCARDGDRAIMQCTTEGTNEIEQHNCPIGNLCYGARDTQEATCVDQEELPHMDPGVEPGSYIWLNKYDERERVREAERARDTRSGSRSCCKVCKSGKACGDSCISSSKSCNTSGGCACNG